MIQSKHLLELAGQNIRKHQELERIKGEIFNVFSILKMERNENRTHSAFIAALLNPSGTHFQGSKFLDIFLKLINDSTIDSRTATISIEHHLGQRNDEENTGGRADLLISDKQGNCLIIENKIDAREQKGQIQRYLNYKQGIGVTVCYLNKFGEDPTEYSKGKLEAGKDFQIISYREHIIAWLELCLKECAELPILRESIKQYLLLIKKITYTMSNESQKEMERLMMQYFDESKTIANQFNAAVNRITHELRKEVIAYLNEHLGQDFIIEEGWSTSKEYAQIWIKYKGLIESKIYYGVESFSYHFNQSLTCGIFVSDNKFKIAYEGGDRSQNMWYPFFDTIVQFNEMELNFSNKELIQKIVLDDSFHNALVLHIGSQIVSYINQHKESLKNYIVKNTSHGQTV